MFPATCRRTFLRKCPALNTLQARRPKSRLPPLTTAERDPRLKRNAQYATVTDEDVNYFESVLDVGGVVTDSEQLLKYNTDWMNIYREQMSAVLRRCYSRRLAVCTQAGNTGLVGGSVAVHDELIVSTERLRRHYHFEPLAGVLSCSSGFILEELDDRLASDGWQMPLDLGAKGSCQIGGNVATAAGGLRLIRYGSLHANVLALTVVVADAQGSVLRLGRPLRKDNTGLHMAQLFVGSEGQLGIITDVALTVVPRPRSIQVALLACPSFSACCRVLSSAKVELGEVLSSFEVMDAEALNCVVTNLQLTNPLEGATAPFFLLVETAGANQEHDAAKMDAFLTGRFEEGTAVNGVLAMDGVQQKHFWRLRESITESLTVDGYVYKNDISLPHRHFYALTEAVRKRVGSMAKRVVTYGHLGDGNTHLNITSDAYDQELYDRLYPFIYEWTKEHGGSISAEHGIGLMKLPYMHLAFEPSNVDYMRQLKRVFDPRSILNPYKTIPASEVSV